MFNKKNTVIRQSGTTAFRRRDKPRHGVWTGVRARCLVFFCLLLPFFAAGTFAENLQIVSEDTTLRIVVHSNGRSTGDRLLLGDVADISGGSPALRQKVSGIDFGPAPRPGKERRVAGHSISSALKSAGWPPEEGRITVPEWVQVQGNSQSLSAESLEKAFVAYVHRVAGGDEVVISRVKVRGISPLPPGKISLLPVGNRDERIKGNASLRLAVSVNGRDCGQVTVCGWVDRYTRAVCATRYIPRGKVLTAEDVCLKRINMSKAPDRIVLDSARAVGMQARTSARPGEYLRQHMLTAPPLIGKGDHVVILASAGGIRVTSVGIAKSEGSRGDEIRVENVESEKMVVGRIVNESTVEVLF